MTTDAFRSHATRAEINVTPLIDVLLALVVILIVAAPMALHRLPMPPDSHNTGPIKRSIALSILPTGELYLEGQAVSRAQFVMTLAAEAAMAQPPNLEICSDADTPYDKVVDTLSIARQSGLTGIAVKTCPRS